MSYTAGMEVLRTHLTAAGSAVSPAVELVRLCGPQAPNQDQITTEYKGDSDNPYLADTLKNMQRGENIEIKAWLLFPTAEQGSAEALELRLRALNLAIQTRLSGDRTLGANVMGLVIGDGSTDTEQWVGPDGQKGPVFRTLSIPVTLAIEDYAAIDN